MAPHEQAEEFISSYRKLMQEDTDINNFQKILEMKVWYYTAFKFRCLEDHFEHTHKKTARRDDLYL